MIDVSARGTCLFGSTWYGTRLKMICQYIWVSVKKLMVGNRLHRFVVWGVPENVCPLQRASQVPGAGDPSLVEKKWVLFLGVSARLTDHTTQKMDQNIAHGGPVGGVSIRRPKPTKLPLPTPTTFFRLPT